MFLPVYQKFGKRLIDLFIGLIGLIGLIPLFLLIAIAIKVSSPGPIIFKQKRAGKNGQPFTFYKFRTMVVNAEQLKTKYLKLNEADGPVFKIKNDPRYTKLGKFLSHTGLDELPQLLNILRGDMSLVGPRPLPVKEEREIPSRWQGLRRSVKPGLTCSWLINGAHGLTFERWMRLDLGDIKHTDLIYDSSVLLRTIWLGLILVKNEISRKNHFPFSKAPRSQVSPSRNTKPIS